MCHNVFICICNSMYNHRHLKKCKCIIVVIILMNSRPTDSKQHSPDSIAIQCNIVKVYLRTRLIVFVSTYNNSKFLNVHWNACITYKQYTYSCNIKILREDGFIFIVMKTKHIIENVPHLQHPQCIYQIKLILSKF